MTFDKARDKEMWGTTFFETGDDVVQYLAEWGHKPRESRRGFSVFEIGDETITINGNSVSMTRINKDKVVMASAICNSDQLFEYKGMLFAGVEACL